MNDMTNQLTAASVGRMIELRDEDTYIATPHSCVQINATPICMSIVLALFIPQHHLLC